MLYTTICIAIYNFKSTQNVFVLENRHGVFGCRTLPATHRPDHEVLWGAPQETLRLNAFRPRPLVTGDARMRCRHAMARLLRTSHP